MRLSAPLYLFDQKDSSLKVVPLGSDLNNWIMLELFHLLSKSRGGLPPLGHPPHRHGKCRGIATIPPSHLRIAPLPLSTTHPATTPAPVLDHDGDPVVPPGRRHQSHHA